MGFTGQPLPRRRRNRSGSAAPSDLPAIQSVEDLFPPEVFFKTVAGGYLEAEEIGNVACANRQFKETSYNPRMTTGRGCVALIMEDARRPSRGESGSRSPQSASRVEKRSYSSARWRLAARRS